MTDKLKPCPFCDGNDLEVVVTVFFSHVNCKNCNIQGPSCYEVDGRFSKDWVAGAAKLWNKRQGENDV